MSDQDEGVVEILARLREGFDDRVSNGVLDMIPERGILEEGIVESAIEKLTFELRDPPALEIQKRSLRTIEKKLQNATYDCNVQSTELPPPPKLAHSPASSVPRDVIVSKSLLETRAVQLLSQHPLIFPREPRNQPGQPTRISGIPHFVDQSPVQVAEKKVTLVSQARPDVPTSLHLVGGVDTLILDQVTQQQQQRYQQQQNQQVVHQRQQQSHHQPHDDHLQHHQQQQSQHPQQQQQPQVVVVNQPVPAQPEPDRATERLAQALQLQLQQQQQVIDELQREVRKSNQPVVVQQPLPAAPAHIDVGVKLPEELTEGLKQLLKDKRQTATRNVTLAIPRMFAAVERKLRDRYFARWQLFILEKVQAKRARRKLQQLQSLYSNTRMVLTNRYYDTLRRNVLVRKFGVRRSKIVHTLLGWMVQWRRRPYWDKWRRYKRKPHSELISAVGTNPQTVNVGTGGLPIIHKHQPVHVPVSSCTVSDMSRPPKPISLLQHSVLNRHIVITKPADTLLPKNNSATYGGVGSPHESSTQRTNFRPFSGDPNVIMTEIENSMAMREEQRVLKQRSTESAHKIIAKHTLEATAQRVLRGVIMNCGDKLTENPILKSKVTIQGPELETFRKRHHEVTDLQVQQLAKKILLNEVLRKKRPVRVEMTTSASIPAVLSILVCTLHFCQNTSIHAGGSIVTSTDVEILVSRMLLQRDQKQNDFNQKLINVQQNEKIERSLIAIDALEFSEFTNRYNLIRRNHSFFINLLWSNVLTAEDVNRSVVVSQCGREYDSMFHRFCSSTIATIATVASKQIYKSPRWDQRATSPYQSPIRERVSDSILQGKEYFTHGIESTRDDVIKNYEFIIKEVDNVVIEDVPINLKNEDVIIAEDIPIRLKEQDVPEQPEDIPIRLQPMIPTFAPKQFEIPTTIQQVDDRVTRLVTDWFQGMSFVHQQHQQKVAFDKLEGVPTPSSSIEEEVPLRKLGGDEITKRSEAYQEQRVDHEGQSDTTYTTTEAMQSHTTYSPSKNCSVEDSTVTSYSRLATMIDPEVEQQRASSRIEKRFKDAKEFVKKAKRKKMEEMVRKFERELRKFLTSEDYGRNVIERHREGAMFRISTFQERRLHEISAQRMLAKLPKSITRPQSPSPRRGRITTQKITAVEIRPKQTSSSHSNLSLLVAALGYLPASVTGVMNTLSSLTMLETVSASENMPIRGINTNSNVTTRLSEKVLQERDSRERVQQKQKQRREFDLRTKDRVRHRLQQQRLLEQQDFLIKKHERELRSKSRRKHVNAIKENVETVTAAPSPLSDLLEILRNDPPTTGRVWGKSYALELLDTASAEDRAADILLSAASSTSMQPASPSPKSYDSQLEYHQKMLRQARVGLLQTDSSKMDKWLSSTLPDKKRGHSKDKKSPKIITNSEVVTKEPQQAFQLLLEEHHKNPLPGCIRQNQSALDLLSFVSQTERNAMQDEVIDSVPVPAVIKQLARPSTTGGIYSGSAVRTVTSKRRNGIKCNPLSGCSNDDCIVKRRAAGEWIKEDSLFTVKDLPIRRHCGSLYSAQQQKVVEENRRRQQGPKPPGEDIITMARSFHPRNTGAAPYKEPRKSSKKVEQKTSKTTKGHPLNVSISDRATPESVEVVRNEIRRLQEILRVKELALAADHELEEHVATKMVPPP